MSPLLNDYGNATQQGSGANIQNGQPILMIEIFAKIVEKKNWDKK